MVELESAHEDLYRDIDPALWDEVNHNPVLFLRRAHQQDLDRVAEDPDYLEQYEEVLDTFDDYMNPPARGVWFQRNYPGMGDQVIAYFSAEFGLHESLPIYSGGLGVLSGDHCKTASDLDLPFVGVGFIYPQGYFRQQIDSDGKQQAIYVKLDFGEIAATPALGADGTQVLIDVDLPGRKVYAKVWRCPGGAHPSLPDGYGCSGECAGGSGAFRSAIWGRPADAHLTGDCAGGLRRAGAAHVLGIRPAVWHLNEGHAAFLQLERMREYVQDEGLSFEAALWAARGDSLFTTHTPVPAGNDAFGFDLIDRFFADYWGKLGLDRERFLDLGRYESPSGPQFGMTVLALRTAGRANGVSKLHGEVPRRMWAPLWPGITEPEVPIEHVTNGVHTESWMHPELAELMDRYLDSDWRDRLDDPALWETVAGVPGAELWAQHEDAKAEMLELVRGTGAQLSREGAAPAAVEQAAHLLDPAALTIGFARRFATYKRATLIFHDQERLKRILNNPERPVQIIFAGKAHPADEAGRALIQTVYQLSRKPEYLGKIVFVEDYDMNVARHLVAGVDVWLNTPRRPHEASGTSGEKAGLNGVLNFSVLDGWWVEGFDEDNGWAIGSEKSYANEAARDEADALSLYTTLEEVTVPLYYDRDEDGKAHERLARQDARFDRLDRAGIQHPPNAQGLHHRFLCALRDTGGRARRGRLTPKRRRSQRGTRLSRRSGRRFPSWPPGLAARRRPSASPWRSARSLRPGALTPLIWPSSWCTGSKKTVNSKQPRRCPCNW